MINKNDLLFLARKTNLSNTKVKLLTEEERDLNLVIQSISDGAITKEDVGSLSFETVAKFVIFKFSAGHKLSVSEIEYVISIFVKYFKELLRTKSFKRIPEKNDVEEFAEYAFILVGFFSHRLSVEGYKKYRNYLNCFRYVNRPEFDNHIETWFEIFNKIKTEEMFA